MSANRVLRTFFMVSLLLFSLFLLFFDKFLLFFFAVSKKVSSFAYRKTINLY